MLRAFDEVDGPSMASADYNGMNKRSQTLVARTAEQGGSEGPSSSLKSLSKIPLRAVFNSETRSSNDRGRREHAALPTSGLGISSTVAERWAASYTDGVPAACNRY